LDPVEQTPDLAGYPSVEQLVAGYRASGDEAKRQRARADQLEQENANLSAALTEAFTPPAEPVAAPRQAVPDRRTRPEERLAEFGLPVDDLRRFVSGHVQELFQPIANGLQARNEFVVRHPDYVQFEQAVA